MLKPTKLKQRLEALENRLKDCSGLMRHSEAWMAYWRDQAHRQFYLNEPGPKVPIEVLRALAAEAGQVGGKEVVR